MAERALILEDIPSRAVKLQRIDEGHHHHLHRSVHVKRWLLSLVLLGCSAAEDVAAPPPYAECRIEIVRYPLVIIGTDTLWEEVWRCLPARGVRA